MVRPADALFRGPPPLLRPAFGRWTGELAAAEATLHDVIARAGGHHRPLLAAAARRDLAHVLRRAGRASEARETAHTARALFEELGCAAEARKLDALVATPG